MTIIEKLAKGQDVTEKEIINELYEICNRVHSSCDSECPVYRLNGNKIPDTANDFSINRGCDCYKDGKAMLGFIQTHS